jgi:hypothetical protein
VNLPTLLAWHIQSQEMLLNVIYTVHTADLKHCSVVFLSAEGSFFLPVLADW